MSLNLDSLLATYDVVKSPLRQMFWRKERQAEGISYPIPIKQQYVDFMKAILGLHLIEMEHLDHVKELEIRTSYPYNFYPITDKLESLFFLLSNHKIRLKINPSRSHYSWKRFDDCCPYQKIVLFSGGLDSLCGALDLSRNHRIVLSHCITNQFVFGRVLKLANVSAFSKSVLYCCDARTKRTTGGMSETRGLLFLSFAYAIAASLQLRSVVFCENGSQMLDVMLGSLTYPNKQATKNTNLNYIKRIEDIFSGYDDKEFRIECPYKDMTKAEMLAPFKGAMSLEDTFSCFTTRFGTAMCGICYNCFIRRCSLLAIGVKEGDKAYEINPLEFDPTVAGKKSYMDTTDILVHLLRFYHKILVSDAAALSEVEINSRDYFKDPYDLATRFACDIFLGVKALLQTTSPHGLNALGKKANELLNQIDKKTLQERKEELAKKDTRSSTTLGLPPMVL